MIYIFAIFIVIPLLFAAFSKKTSLFINIYGLGLNLMPIIQMLLYPDYKLDGHYRDVVLQKIIFDLVFFLGTVIFIVRANIRINKKLLSIFIFYLLLTIPSVILSEDFHKSLFIYTIAILSPISFGFLLYSTVKSSSKIIDYLFNWIGIALTVKYMSIILNGFRTGIWNFGYGANDFSVIRGNSVVSTLSILIPLFFVIFASKKSSIKWVLVAAFSLLTLLISGSRMGLFCVVIGLLMTIKSLNINRVILLSSFIILLNGIYEQISSRSMFEFFIDRFAESGSVVGGVSQDGRVLIWGSTLELWNERKGKLLGLGLFSDYSIYSNAHSLYLNQFIERGFLGVVGLLLLLFSVLRRSLKQTGFRWLFAGTIIFALASATGEDLFSISRVVHGYVFYVLVFLSIALYKGEPSWEYK